MFVLLATRFGLFTVSVWLLLSLAGCFSFGGGEEEELANTQPRYYVIDVNRATTATEFARDRVLLLKPIRVVPQYRSTDIVFKTGDNEYHTQPPHVFFTDTQDMFNDQLRRWLQKSGLFSQVIVDENQPADYILEPALTALYGEQRAAYSPQAVLEMQFFLYAGEDNQNTAFQTGLRMEVDIEESTPPKVVTGWNQGLSELLFTLEEDLSGYFAKLP
jgi:uncharacterized lipoprotein YmbA